MLYQNTGVKEINQRTIQVEKGDFMCDTIYIRKAKVSVELRDSPLERVSS
jgi:hypothetical protein